MLAKAELKEDERRKSFANGGDPLERIFVRGESKLVVK